MEMEKEEGEMSDNEMEVDDIVVPAMQDIEKHTVLYKKEKNGLVLELLEKVDAHKLEERAKRFGFSLTGNRVVTQEQIDDLYNNFGIKEGNERHFRFDTLHLAGIDGLSTKDIFEYLEDYKPVAIEWIDNNSCNIVCQDHIAVALALLLHSREITDEDLKEMIHEKSSYHWREGLPHPNVDMILMRFATHSDKKITKIKYEKQIAQSMDDGNAISKNPWGDLCMSWGVYDHQEVFRRKLPQDYDDDEEDNDNEPNKRIQIKSKQLAMRLGKRSNKTEDSDEGSSDSEWKKKSKTPRMRMHADDEECKQKKPVVEHSEEENTYAPLSIEVINTTNDCTPRTTLRVSEKFKSNAKTDNTFRKKSLKSRLGAKVPARDPVSSDESSDNSDSLIMSRVQKVNKVLKPHSSSVWSRLELKSGSVEEPKDLRQKLKSRKQKKPDDLRDVLSKTKQSNLIIELDNRNK
ncbi:PREDICTED: uncharacterized protein C17orf85 homolog [Papilio xuthus]|uniref:Nuclear cap-binding protein subunit 3 n=1 Tax=Papilio xuthus TaxID=66420 RepID=A0A194PKA8_PAPXU|nr:PREDICTED: uncharacterized protein C17orf85 homolog [Papilio xuthus]KPI91530.1 Uncharacterized protein C17orf85-like [Papilio xuthus]